MSATPHASTKDGLTPVNLLASRGVATSRRYTPYQRTPAIRRIAGGAISRAQDEEVDVSHFKELLNKTWKIYRVTPLYNFSQHTKDLKRYAKLLSAYIQCETRKGVALDVEQANLAEISIYEGLSGTEGGAEAVKIVLKAKPKSKSEPPKTVLYALLCGVCIDAEVMSTMMSDFTLLPVMMVKGTMGLTKHMQQWFQMQFDCSMSLLRLSSLNLSWMVAMWSGQVSGKRNKPVELTYSVPEVVAGLDRINLSLDPNDCSDLWNCVHDAESDSFTEDEVLAFIKSIELHLYNHLRVRLEPLQLSRVGTSAAMVSNDSRMKFFKVSHVNPILRHLCELALEQVLV